MRDSDLIIRCTRMFTAEDIKKVRYELSKAAAEGGPVILPPGFELARSVASWKRISPAGIYECTNCHINLMTSDINVYKYCHGCGSIMDKPEERSWDIE